MPALKKSVVTDALTTVQVHYLDKHVSKWWNAQRSAEDTAVFCGWYWIRGGREAGPFRTRSAALRDAYYAFVLKQDLPVIWKTVPKRLGGSGGGRR